ncbi:ANTAR domain-containing response regulator [Janthinobacterium sp. B9-8]|uniref:ANTAR domain-containing response regulator n=1 Tax=Janthinobacterium sp. B9-8 TaxID=1236179 RepID=UPI00061D3350|nr:ANTAR domain-containing protein [Janthinobacterium sp. B9-8]
MLRILLVNESPKSSKALGQALQDDAYTLLPELNSASCLWQEAKKSQPDLILINTCVPSQTLLEQLQAMRGAVPVLMLVEGLNQVQIQASLQAGVSHLIDCFAAEKWAGAVMMAFAQFEQSKALQQRISLLEQQLADRKVIDQAKGLLMDKRRLSEGEAYETLRRQAMKQGMKLGDVARQVLAMADLLG